MQYTWRESDFPNYSLNEQRTIAHVIWNLSKERLAQMREMHKARESTDRRWYQVWRKVWR